MTAKRNTPTTKTVDDLVQLRFDRRIVLKPDYQRNSIWPPKARGYLIDTMLNDLPVPLLFLARERDSNTNRLIYRVIDGQQRIRAAIDFVNGNYSIPNEYGIEVNGKQRTRVRFMHLPEAMKDQVMGYSFVVMELSGYSEAELRDIFVRINKYVVRLNPQELRDARPSNAFRRFVDEVAQDAVWDELEIFSTAAEKRKRNLEFIGELAILLLEGPQDKKGSLDLYYGAADDQFDDLDELKVEVLSLARAASSLIAELPQTSRFRKLPAFYGLIGALRLISESTDGTVPNAMSTRLSNFDTQVESLPELDPAALPTGEDETNTAERLAYVFRESVSRQTDNIRPRRTRIRVLCHVLAPAQDESSDV